MLLGRWALGPTLKISDHLSFPPPESLNHSLRDIPFNHEIVESARLSRAGAGLTQRGRDGCFILAWRMCTGGFDGCAHRAFDLE